MSNAIELQHIRKYFASSQVLACDDVSLSVESGEVHAIVGENGAGKTTLMSILYGLLTPDEGQILIKDSPVRITHPNDAIRNANDAIRNGIGMVHQHFKLVPSFTIAQNIMLGIEPNRAGFINVNSEAEQVRNLAESFGLPVNPDLPVREISVGMQQRVEILKILQRNAQILILDEPTAVLTPQEVREFLTVVRRFLTVVRRLAGTGRTILFITHKLAEVKAIADRVTTMRRGRNVGTHFAKDQTIRDMANLMVGRVVTLTVEKGPAHPGETVLQAENLLVAGADGIPAVFGASLDVRAGEILGVAGVSGNGQTELVEAIVGMRPVDGGTIRYLGQNITHALVRERREAGLAHIPEDRLTTGLNLTTNLDENVVVTSYQHKPYSQQGIFSFAPIRALAQEIIDKFAIRRLSTNLQLNLHVWASQSRLSPGGTCKKLYWGGN